jgi:chromosome partitioning protein
MTIEALQKLGTQAYKILLTIVPPRPMPDGDNARKTIVSAGLPIFRAEVRRTVAFQRSALDGVTVDRVRANDTAGLAWRDYQQIGEEIETLNAKVRQSRRQSV